MEAKTISDGRYQAYAKALGASSPQLPSPEVKSRANDTVFVYVEPTTKNKITVIVEKWGKLADTVEPSLMACSWSASCLLPVMPRRCASSAAISRRVRLLR